LCREDVVRHASMTALTYGTPIFYALSHTLPLLHHLLSFSPFLPSGNKQHIIQTKNAPGSSTQGLMPFSHYGRDRFNPPSQLYFHHLQCLAFNPILCFITFQDERNISRVRSARPATVRGDTLWRDYQIPIETRTNVSMLASCLFKLYILVA